MGGGAATNAGIDFQTRVAALATVSMLADAADLSSFGLGYVGEVPVEVRFETADRVDDIVLVLPSGRILVQAKNSIDLSSGVDSELAKVVRQIVAAYCSSKRGDRYLLAVSPSASARIRQDLEKLCHSYRLNFSGSVNNPLTTSEMRTFEVFRDHVLREYVVHTGESCTTKVFDRILAATHVVTFDIAEGHSGERNAITALSTIMKSNPILLWNSLLTMCTSLARDRMSIDTHGLRLRFEPLLCSGAVDATKSNNPLPPIALEGSVSMGREVVLVEDEDGRTAMLFELGRFDSDGARRVRYANGFVEISSNLRYRILRRTATYAGMVRELEDYLHSKIRGELVVVGTDLDDLDASPFAQAHAARFRDAIETTSAALVCLVCGRPISQNMAYSVEIDDADHPYQVGVVHRECLRPMHRVIGTLAADAVAVAPSLVDFDYRTWISKMHRGQACWNSARAGGMAGCVVIAWNPDNSTAASGGWSVRYDLSDGTSRYALVRSRVWRGSRQMAEDLTRQLNDSAARDASNGDPKVYGLRGYNRRSLAICAEDPNPPSVLSHRAVPITEATVAAYSTAENYYAPVFYLSDSTTGRLFDLNGIQVLLTDPLRYDDMVANWRLAGIRTPDHLSATIVASDTEFDLFMMRANARQQVVYIDPIFNSTGRLVGGFQIVNFDTIGAQGSTSASPGD